MRLHLHFIGGGGKIGAALLQSIIENPIENLEKIWIYCDITKYNFLRKKIASSFSIQTLSYSGFNINELVNKGHAEMGDHHAVVNLRGVNNKRYWVNQPLEAMELHKKSCECIINSDLWMYPGSFVIHMSSQLCELLEGPNALEDICAGQESYRRPYMISRLHQEELLTANAYKHCVSTHFLRLSAVYGFADDKDSPWVLNSLVKQYVQNKSIKPRSPNSFVYLCHRKPLIKYLRDLICDYSQFVDKPTVVYSLPPTLKLPISDLAVNIVNSVSTSPSSSFLTVNEKISLIGEFANYEEEKSNHLNLLQESIKELLKNDGN